MESRIDPPAPVPVRPRLAATWRRGDGSFAVREPDDAELEAHAPALAPWYDDPRNQALMTMTPRPIAAADVCAIHRDLRARGGRTFLHYCDGAPAGDADLRRIEADRVELAMLIGEQGRGRGTAFSILLGALAFRALGLRALYLSVTAANTAARRCYEKAGYFQKQINCLIPFITNTYAILGAPAMNVPSHDGDLNNKSYQR